MPQLKVLIAGAGIAGNALAFWLTRQGHKVTVLERFPAFRTSGLQLDLRGPGVEVMKRMGLEEAFRAKQVPEMGLQVVDKNGKRRGYFPANTSGKGLQSFTTDAEIMRADLCNLLYDACKDKTTFMFGKTIDAFQDTGEVVQVSFSDGQQDEFDLLIGADGHGSRTRKMMLGPDAPDAFKPLGSMYTSYFTIPKAIQEKEEYIATMYIAPKGRMMMTRRNKPDTLQVYLGCGAEATDRLLKNRGDVPAEKAILAELALGSGPHIEEAAKLMLEADDFYLEHMGVVRLEKWSKGRVSLVGDAAYGPSAMTGMGTTSAMVGAYILAGELSRHIDPVKDMTAEDTSRGITTALEAYENKFQPFMKQVTKDIDETKNPYSGMPTSALGISILHAAIGVVSSLKLDILGRMFLREKVKDWELPVYERLEL